MKRSLGGLVEAKIAGPSDVAHHPGDVWEARGRSLLGSACSPRRQRKITTNMMSSRINRSPISFTLIVANLCLRTHCA